MASLRNASVRNWTTRVAVSIAVAGSAKSKARLESTIPGTHATMAAASRLQLRLVSCRAPQYVETMTTT